MIVKLLTEHHLEFLSLTGGCRGSSKSTLVKMSNCWKSHAAAHFSCVEPVTILWVFCLAQIHNAVPMVMQTRVSSSSRVTHYCGGVIWVSYIPR